MAKEIIEAMVANKLKVARGKAGLTQSDVAEKLGVTRQTVINYETNPLNVKCSTLLTLAHLYGCSASYFFE